MKNDELEKKNALIKSNFIKAFVLISLGILAVPSITSSRQKKGTTHIGETKRSGKP